jgi:hypothetical protein
MSYARKSDVKQHLARRAKKTPYLPLVADSDAAGLTVGLLSPTVTLEEESSAGSAPIVALHDNGGAIAPASL